MQAFSGRFISDSKPLPCTPSDRDQYRGVRTALAHCVGARRTRPLYIPASCRLDDMARVVAIQTLRLSDDRQIEAHILAGNGHVLLIPLCRLVRCNGKDPWRRGRKTLQSVVKKLVARGGVGENALASQDECGARAMHHLVVDAFLQQYYRVPSVRDACLKSLDEAVARTLSEPPVPPPTSAAQSSVTESGTGTGVGTGASASNSDNRVDVADGVQARGQGSNTRSLPFFGSERARDEDVLRELSETGETQPVFEPLVVQSDVNIRASDARVGVAVGAHAGAQGSNTRSHPFHGRERARDEDVLREPSDSGRTHPVNYEPMVIHYGGSQWVDAVAEWDAVPAHLQFRKAMWHVRLGGVGISIATCRVAKVGDIRKLVEAHTGGSKSVYVPLALWTTMLERVHSSPEDRPEHWTENETDNVVHCELEHSLSPLELRPDEIFRHDGAVLNIATYGERSRDGFYASYEDFVKALAVRQSSRMPDVEVFTAQVATGRSTTVLAFRSMLRLVALYAHKSSVASALMDWVTEVVFSAQFGDGASVQKQGAYAVRAGLADRTAPYSSCDWSFNGVHASIGLYQDEVCSGVSARKKWAPQVDAALANLPDGTDIDITSVVKAGHTINKAERSPNIRSAMRKAFGSETDVRTISFARCPGGTRDTLLPLETGVLEEFDQYRLRGVQGVPGQEQTELFLVTPAISQKIASSLSVAAEKFANSRMAEADARVRESDARVSATAVLEERASRLMQERDCVVQERDRIVQESNRRIEESGRVQRDLEHVKRRIGDVGAALRECLDDRDATAQTVIHRITRALV